MMLATVSAVGILGGSVIQAEQNAVLEHDPARAITVKVSDVADWMIDRGNCVPVGANLPQAKPVAYRGSFIDGLFD